jgi:hypothetical protein
LIKLFVSFIFIQFKGSDGSSGGGGGGGGGSGSASASIRSSSRRTSEEPHIGKYRLLKTIGKGNFAKVKLAKHIPTGKEVMRLFSKFVFVQFATVHNTVISRNLSLFFCCSFCSIVSTSWSHEIKQQQHAFCPMAIVVTAPLMEFLYLTWFTRFFSPCVRFDCQWFFCVSVYERTRRM